MTELPLLPDRLPARTEARPRVLFVGINPGVRSSQTGHHFAGYSNRFWKLLADAGLTPRLATYADDVLMPSWGYGMTNLVPRPTRGIDDLSPDEYRAGRARLERTIRRVRPQVVALLGVTLARALLARVDPPVGLQQETLAGATVFVLPNPSGRNANFTYAGMLSAFRALQAHVKPSSG